MHGDKASMDIYPMPIIGASILSQKWLHVYDYCIVSYGITFMTYDIIGTVEQCNIAHLWLQ